MKNIRLNNIEDITLEEAMRMYKEERVVFIIKDGKIKGLSK